jgi:hypothetical protein
MEEAMNVQEVALINGIFTLSLDIELCWGVVDKPNQLKKNMVYYQDARDCIDKILKLLEKYNISATWAVVGHLFLKECNSKDGQKHIDIPRSIYPWFGNDWFEESPCTSLQENPLWYGRDIVEKIMSCRVRQEIACHSFSHIPYGDKDTKKETVQADLRNCIEEAEKLGLKLRSFVFPRNIAGYLNELSSFGFEAYRGIEASWYSKFSKRLKKVCHIIDQLLAISPPVSLPECDHGLVNIPASMFYLPMNGFRSLIPINRRIQKAKAGIRKAARDKKVFHLWFHPFNLATNKEKLLYGLEEIFKLVQLSRENGELQIKSMDEIVDLIDLN